MEIMTLEEVATLLRVKPGWIYARTRAGGEQSPIPHYKAGRLLRFDRAEVLAWWARLHRGDAQSLGSQPDEQTQAIVQTAVN